MTQCNRCNQNFPRIEHGYSSARKNSKIRVSEPKRGSSSNFEIPAPNQILDGITDKFLLIYCFICMRDFPVFFSNNERSFCSEHCCNVKPNFLSSNSIVNLKNKNLAKIKSDRETDSKISNSDGKPLLNCFKINTDCKPIKGGFLRKKFNMLFSKDSDLGNLSVSKVCYLINKSFNVFPNGFNLKNICNTTKNSDAANVKSDKIQVPVTAEPMNIQRFHNLCNFSVLMPTLIKLFNSKYNDIKDLMYDLIIANAKHFANKSNFKKVSHSEYLEFYVPLSNSIIAQIKNIFSSESDLSIIREKIMAIFANIEVENSKKNPNTDKENKLDAPNKSADKPSASTERFNPFETFEQRIKRRKLARPMTSSTSTNMPLNSVTANNVSETKINFVDGKVNDSLDPRTFTYRYHSAFNRFSFLSDKGNIETANPKPTVTEPLIKKSSVNVSELQNHFPSPANESYINLGNLKNADSLPKKATPEKKLEIKNKHVGSVDIDSEESDSLSVKDLIKSRDKKFESFQIEMRSVVSEILRRLPSNEIVCYTGIGAIGHSTEATTPSKITSNIESEKSIVNEDFNDPFEIINGIIVSKNADKFDEIEERICITETDDEKDNAGIKTPEFGIKAGLLNEKPKKLSPKRGNLSLSISDNHSVSYDFKVTQQRELICQIKDCKKPVLSGSDYSKMVADHMAKSHGITCAKKNVICACGESVFTTGIDRHLNSHKN